MRFISKIDNGNPRFSEFEGGVYRILAVGDLDKGRWVHDFNEPLSAGARYRIHGRVGTTAPLLRVSLVWIANLPGEKIHAVEHAVEAGPGDEQPFEHAFVVPQGVKRLRVELRGRSGAGLYEFRDMDIETYEDDSDHPTTEDDPGMLVTSIIVGKTRWRVTASEQSITFLKLDHQPLLEGNQKQFWID